MEFRSRLYEHRICCMPKSLEFKAWLQGNLALHNSQRDAILQFQRERVSEGASLHPQDTVQPASYFNSAFPSPFSKPHPA